MSAPVENKQQSKPRRYIPRSKRALYPDLVSDLPATESKPVESSTSRPDRTRPWLQKGAERKSYAGVFVVPEQPRPRANPWGNPNQRKVQPKRPLVQQIQEVKKPLRPVSNQPSRTSSNPWPGASTSKTTASKPKLPPGMIDLKTSLKKKKKKKKPKPKSKMTLEQEERARINRLKEAARPKPQLNKLTLWDQLTMTNKKPKKKKKRAESWANALQQAQQEPSEEEEPLDAFALLKNASTRLKIEKPKVVQFRRKEEPKRPFVPKKNKKPTKLKLSIKEFRTRREVREVLESMLTKIEESLEKRYYEDAFQPDERWRLGNTKWPSPTPTPTPPPATPPPVQIPLDENGIPDVSQFVPVESTTPEGEPDPPPVKRVWGVVPGEAPPEKKQPVMSLLELIRKEKEKAKKGEPVSTPSPVNQEESPEKDDEESIKSDEPEGKSLSPPPNPEPKKPTFNPSWKPPERRYPMTVIRASANKKTMSAVLDPTEETSWISGTNSEKEPNQWLIFDFGRRSLILGLSIMARRENYTGGRDWQLFGVCEFVFETSSDTHSWFKVGRFDADETVAHFQYFPLLTDVKKTEGRFARISFPAAEGPVQIVRVEFNIGKDLRRLRKFKLPSKWKSFQQMHCDQLMSQQLQEKVYRHYVRNTQCVELVEKVTYLLERLIFFYRRAKDKNPKRAKRRIICGMNEIRNKRDLIIGLLVATNIEHHHDPNRPNLNNLIKDITSSAEEENIPVIYVGTLKSLAKAVHKNRGVVSAVGLLSVDGARPTWKEICTIAESLREEKMMAEADYLPISTKALKDYVQKKKHERSMAPDVRSTKRKGSGDVKNSSPALGENPNSSAAAGS